MTLQIREDKDWRIKQLEKRVVKLEKVISRIVIKEEKFLEQLKRII